MSYDKPTDKERKQIFENSLIPPSTSKNQISGDQKTQIVNSDKETIDFESLLTRSILSLGNTHSTRLLNGEGFIGTAELNDYRDVLVSCKTDQPGLLYLEFSNDGINWDTLPAFEIAANTHEFHVLLKGPRRFRARFSNNSGANQTYFRLYCYYGDFRQGNSPLNSTIQQDADTIIVRPLDFNLLLSKGLYQNHNNTIKDGINFSISSNTVPEDVWGGGDVYNGFPTDPKAGSIVVAGADTGTVYYSYMASSSDTDYTFASKAITGAGTYSLGHNIWRCNFAYFQSSSAINVGDISVIGADGVTFCVIPAGYGQTYCGAYTVPNGSSIFIDRITATVRGSTSASLDGFFYYKPISGSPYMRFPFEAQYGALYFDDVDYLIKIPELVDIVPRIITCSGNGVQVKVSYRIVKVKN